MAKKHLKKCSTTLIIRKMAKINNQVTADAGEHVEKEEHSSTVGRVVSWYNYSENLAVSQKIEHSTT